MGFVVFPLLFTMGVSPEKSGPNAMFVSLATAFANLPTGRLLGAIFFGFATIAALSSSIALLELIVAYLIETYGITRKVAAFRSGIAMFILGIPTALSMTILGLYDGLISQVVIILSALLLAGFGGWVFKDALTELQLGAPNLGGWGTAWLWMVRIPVVIVLVVSLVLGVGKFFEQLRGLISG
jgi:NSS family neurotransmitter:Na+ symporter